MIKPIVRKCAGHRTDSPAAAPNAAQASHAPALRSPARYLWAVLLATGKRAVAFGQRHGHPRRVAAL